MSLQYKDRSHNTQKHPQNTLCTKMLVKWDGVTFASDSSSFLHFNGPNTASAYFQHYSWPNAIFCLFEVFLNIELCKSGPLHHEVDPRLLPLLPESTHRVQTASDSHQQASKTGIDDHLIALLLDLEHNAIHHIIIAILFRRLIEFLLRVDVLDMVAVGNLDEEGISDRNRVDLDVDIHLDVPAVLLVGVGDQMHP